MSPLPVTALELSKPRIVFDNVGEGCLRLRVQSIDELDNLYLLWDGAIHTGLDSVHNDVLKLILSITERFDTSTPIGKAMLMIVMVFAQLERETIQQRVIDAYRSRSRKGFYMAIWRTFKHFLRHRSHVSESIHPSCGAITST